MPILRFLVVGACNTGLTYALFSGLLRLFGGRPLAAGIAQSLAYGAGVVTGYIANRTWTFKSSYGHGRTLPRFIGAQLATLALSTVLIQAAVMSGGLSATAAWVLVTGITTVTNFAVQRYWVFRSGRGQ